MNRDSVVNRLLTRGNLAANAALALVYAAAGIAGLQFTFFHPSVTTVWAPSGIALAAVLLCGLRLLPGVALGAFLVNLWASNVSAALGVSLGNTLEALCGFWLLTRLAGLEIRLTHLRDMVFLMLCGAATASVVAATLGPLALWLSGALPFDEFGKAWLIWWLGDSLGILLFTPLILSWVTRPKLDLLSVPTWQALALLSAQTGVAIIVFRGELGMPLNVERATYALLPFAIWLAVACPLRFSTVASVLLSAVAVWYTAQGHGPFAAGMRETDLLLLHLFLVVVAFTSLLVAGVNAERTVALRDTRRIADRFRNLIDLSSDWYWEQDNQYRVTYMSPRYSARTGLAMKPTLGQTRFETDNIWESEEQKRDHRATLDARQPFRDLRLSRCDEFGELHYMSISGDPVFDPPDRFVGYRGVGRDITTQVQAERALRESEERLKLQFEAMPIACVAFDQSFRVTDWNPAAERIFGFPKEEVLGRSPFDFLIPESARFTVMSQFEALQHGQISVDGANENITRSGAMIVCRWHNTALTNAAGELVGYIAMAEDVTAVVEAERALRESEERFRNLTELSSDWYWEQDAELRFTFVSTSVQEATHVRAEDRLGMRRWEIPNLVFDEEELEAHRNLLAARKRFQDFVYKRIRDDGSVIYVSITGTPVFDSSGVFKGYRGVGRDVTARRLAEKRVARLRDFYAALSKANNAIIHARDERQLFDEICDVAVTYGGVIFARICLIDTDTDFLKNIAVAGRHQDYPDKAAISINPDLPEGQGPAGIALRTDTPYIGNDIQSDQRNRLWLEAMLATGARSMVVFPLHRRGKVVGSLHLYAAEKNWFDSELVELISELTANMSFALDNFDRDSARRGAERALRDSEQRFRDIAEAAGEYMWETDIEGRFTYLSPRVVDVLGYTAEELTGHSPTEFMPAGEADRVRQWLADNMKTDRSFRGLEHMFISKAADTLWLHNSAVAIRDEQGRPTGHRGTTRDITELKKSEARISYLATRDPLTELPNRLLFNDRLEQGIITARRKRDQLGVLFIDLDRFKNINDSLGHHIGDLLLKEVSNRMSSCIRKGDTLSRLGGDEFVVTLEGLAHAEDAAQVARKIIESLTRPVEVGGYTLNTSCSIGISIYPNDAEDGRELMKNADTAMYHAKERGRNNFQFFSPEMNLRAVERHQLETEMRRALEANQFVLHYQPQADIRSGKLVGMEALIRWQHPERGLVPPTSFIPVAEESGLIELIGQWALKTASEQNQQWQRAGLPALKVAVNISARQFNDPRGFANVVTRLLNVTGLDPRYLELEMTESMLIRNVDENVAVLRRLGKLGTRLAVDDFGTGYSSLAYLKQLPIDTLKIDRTFVRDIESDPDDAAIIQAIIAMAHGLDLRVTAEGVETQGQLSALKKLGCDEIQGYLLSKPLPAEEFAARFLAPSGQEAHKPVSARVPASRSRDRRA